MLYVNIPPIMPRKHIFTEETLQSLVELGKILRKISDRLIKEVWTFENGTHVPPPGYEAPKQGRKRKDSK